MPNEKSIITLNGSLCCDTNMKQLTKNLTSLDGVEDARGSFASDRITVSYESESVSVGDITAEIGDAGAGVEETVTVDMSDT